jgi:hypothetical protein
VAQLGQCGEYCRRCFGVVGGAVSVCDAKIVLDCSQSPRRAGLPHELMVIDRPRSRPPIGGEAKAMLYSPETSAFLLGHAGPSRLSPVT